MVQHLFPTSVSLKKRLSSILLGSAVFHDFHTLKINRKQFWQLKSVRMYPELL
jgi:hypothetical protein